MLAKSALFEVELDQRRVLDVGLGRDVLELERQADDAEGTLGGGGAAQALDGLVDDGHERRVRLVLRLAAEGL